MRTLLKYITMSSKVDSDFETKYLFNASELLSLLLYLRELRDFEISLTEIYDGTLMLKIGNSIYQISQHADE
jgi:hypothetical protein